jgi:uncharacterized repeat protein (TIGR03803 family)
MDSARTKREAKDGLDTSDVAPRIGSTKLTAAISRSALTLAVLSTLLLVAARPAQAQSETVLYNFTGISDGANPDGSLTSDGKGNFYGTTIAGALRYGTVFELSPNGSGGWNQTTLYTFTGGTDGGGPEFVNVIFDSLGNLYGTAYLGGANGYGVVWELSPPVVGTSWTETVLHSFGDGTDTVYPVGGVIMDSAGNLYGTSVGDVGGAGVVFELSPSGGGWTEQNIYEIGDVSSYAGLTMDGMGNIYGAQVNDVFELSPNGSGGWNSVVIHNFAGGPKDGTVANGTPVLDKAGNLYGTTQSGGTKNLGTVYKLTPVTTGPKKGTWTEKILYSFKGGTKDGGGPFAGIVFGAAGNIYGTTTGGGKYTGGTVYELALSGTTYKEKILWNFNNADGYLPYGGVILDSAGNLYGTAYDGGSFDYGVVFEVNPGAKATATALTSAPNPSTSGEQVTFTAVVTPAPPDGELVSFMDGATLLGTGPLTSGSATFATSALPVGMSQITAVYGGDSDFGGSTSKALKQTVKK